MNPWIVVALELVVVLAVVVGVVIAAAAVSIALVPFAVLVLLVLMVKLGHRASWLRRVIRESDDLNFISTCRSGAGSFFRRLYRGLPADPRCRFCLVPFGGLGKLIGIVPSRKNPNFCPG